MVESNFNVLEHNLVPEHYLLSPEDAEKVLAELNITKDQLPKILENIYGPIPEGSIIKIIRKSATAEAFVTYRLVIKEVKG